MNQYSEDPSQKVCPSLKQLREKYRVEIKKQANEDIFNSKRLKFSENFQAEQLNTYKILVNINDFRLIIICIAV